MNIEIRPVMYKDIDNIVQIHIRAFSGFFMTKLGGNFLKVYYRTVFDYSGKIFLAAEYDGLLIGFVAGFIDPAKFYSLMKDRKIRFALSILPSLFRNPRLILQVWRNFRRINDSNNESNKIEVELASIAVDPSYTRKGCGKLLVKAFLEKAQQLGADVVYLTTDAQNNDAVNYFYQSLGFILYRTFETSSDRIMNEYRFYFEK